MDKFEFRILNWNIGGAKYLEEPEDEREQFRFKLNDALVRLIGTHQPDIVTLQEIVEYGELTKQIAQYRGDDEQVIQYGEGMKNVRDIIDCPPGYAYHKFPLIESAGLSIRAKWRKLEKSGRWPGGIYFAQGNGFLFRNDVPHQPVWALPIKGDHEPRTKRSHYIEKVSLESGLYFGDRDSEPRAALVAHFVYNDAKGKPLDIFVVNLHLTTLTTEREGVPEIDSRATGIRLGQLDVVFNGIVSRYNFWRRGGFRERGESRQAEVGESFDRHEPTWILAGDFNCTPESQEYRRIHDLNFMDVVPHKGAGTKAAGAGKRATLTLDYVFAGPKFVSLNPHLVEEGIQGNAVCSDVRVSDHFPMVATIPIWR